MFTVYLLKSKKNGRSYVGLTSKPVRERVQEHNWGSNKWTKASGPFELKYYETFVCKADAARRERFFKSGQGKKLRKIILENF